MAEDETGIRGRVTKQGEEAIGKLAHDLLKNPLVNGTMTAAFDARERAARAQELAMAALNLPSASDLERLTRRLRGVSQRIEGLEDGLDRISERLDTSHAAVDLEKRLEAIEATLARLEKKLGPQDPS
jgi:predicted  nucleic acid-binding Zn-ribbon protein